MATKNIAIIIEQLKQKKQLADYAGIWAEVPEESWKGFESAVSEARRGLHRSLSKRTEA